MRLNRFERSNANDRNAICTLCFAVVLAGIFATVPVSSAQTRICDPRTYNARGDGAVKDTKAIQQAIDACAKDGGGTVRLSAGTYLSAPIVLKSKITLHLEQGATLLGLTRPCGLPCQDGVPRSGPSIAGKRHQRRQRGHYR